MDGWPPATSRMAKCLLKEDLSIHLHNKKLLESAKLASYVVGVLLNPVPEPWRNWEAGHLIRTIQYFLCMLCDLYNFIHSLSHPVSVP